MDTFPDLGSLSDQELKDLIQQLTEEELEISYKRRILHGKIDILRAELVNRLRKKHEGGEDVISGADVQRLTDILAGRAAAAERADRSPSRAARVALHCPECGFVNAEGANYCQKCGAFLAGARGDARDEPTTATYRIGETGELEPGRARATSSREGAALVIRAGGGRVGESFALDGERMTIGRRPDSRRLPRRRDRLARPRAARAPRRRLLPRRPRLAQRHLRQPPPDRVAPARGRRRAADRQVQAHLPGAT